MTDFWAHHPYKVQAAPVPYAFSDTNGLLRFELRSGDHAMAHDKTNERAEITADSALYIGRDYKMSYSFMIEPGAANTASFFKLNQIHQKNDPWDKQASPEFEVGLDGEKLSVRVDGDPNIQTTSLIPAQLLYKSPTDLVRGVWHTVNIDVKLGPAGDGALKVAVDGAQIVDFNGVIGYNDNFQGYWKMGLYRGAAPETIVGDFKDFEMNSVWVASAETINGTGKADSLFGYGGDDNLSGGLGDDLIRGGSGNDTLWGGAGNDWMSGDTGSDILKGGSGRDTFYFQLGDGVDHVVDFDKKNDHIQLAPGSKYTLSWDGYDTTVVLSNDDHLILTGSHVYIGDGLIIA